MKSDLVKIWKYNLFLFFKKQNVTSIGFKIEEMIQNHFNRDFLIKTVFLKRLHKSMTNKSDAYSVKTIKYDLMSLIDVAVKMVQIWEKLSL